MTAAKPKLTADDLKRMIRVKHKPGKWATFFEVRDAAGFQARRSCDAMAMGLWPSGGLELHGFEVKTSRADFLNEIRDPDKAAAFKQFCDRWWLVAASRDIVQDDLPAGWGMMWARGSKLVVSVGAPKLEPSPLDRNMLATILKRSAAGHGSLLEEERQGAYDEGKQRGEEMVKWSVERKATELKELKKSIAAFEAVSGLDINEYNGDRLGAAVEALRTIRGKWGPLRKLIGSAEKMRERADEAISVATTLEAYAMEAGLIEAKGEEP